MLSNPTRRTKYDKTGRTEEGLFAGRGEDGEPFEWNEYFKELWTGQVNGKTLEEFKKNYQGEPVSYESLFGALYLTDALRLNSAGTDEEKEDLYAAYTESSGSLEAIFTLVPCSELLHDEERFIELVESAIKAGTLERLPQWDADVKDKTKRAGLRKKAKKEAKEAEEYAKELGVWDDLFGDGSSASNKDGAKGKAKDGASKGKGKAGKKDAGGEEDISGLAALIRNRQTSRQNGLDNLISRYEADAASGSSKGKGKSKQKKGEAPAAGAPPTDEEFEALQKKMFGGEKRKKEEAGSASAAGSKKKQKKG